MMFILYFETLKIEFLENLSSHNNSILLLFKTEKIRNYFIIEINLYYLK